MNRSDDAGHDSSDMMERRTATDLADHLKALDGPMNAAMDVVETIADPNQRRVFRKAFAQVVGLVYTDIWLELGKEHPDLLPNKEDLDRTESAE